MAVDRLRPCLLGGEIPGNDELLRNERTVAHPEHGENGGLDTETKRTLRKEGCKFYEKEVFQGE